MRILWCAMVLLGAAPLALPAADTDEEKAVVAAIQKVFDGMAAHDPAMIRSVVTEDARLTRVRGDQPVASSSIDQFVHGIEGNQSRLLERMWDPKVMVSGRLAAVWAPYDFHADGKLNHCGIDSFLMVKTAEGWKITSIAYTVVTESCAPSPLGPPK
jgi:ketosteroid isomerase-like protein